MLLYSMELQAMKQALVSVIVPVYNQEKYLRQTLDSICGQTYRNLEIIMVDDGSTDSSPAILAEYAAKDSRIIVLTQKNQYAGVARNYGMSVAHGKYFSLIDSDDLFKPEMIERMVERAEATHADIVMCTSARLNDRGEISEMPWQLKQQYLTGINKYLFSPAKDIPWYSFQFHVGWSWDKLYRADFVRKHSFAFAPTRHGNDGPFVFPSVVAAESMSIIDDYPMVHYRLSSQQLTSSGSMSKAPTSCLESIQAIYSKTREVGVPQEVIDSFNCWVMVYLHWNITKLSGEARGVLIKEIKERFEPQYRILERIPVIRSQKAFMPLCDEIGKSIEAYMQAASPEVPVPSPREKVPSEMAPETEDRHLLWTRKSRYKKKTILLFGILPIWSVNEKNGRKSWRVLGIRIYRKRIK